jgi:hypothetical protein
VNGLPQPATDQLQEVFKELSARDKGAARAVRERLDEIRRARGRRSLPPNGRPRPRRCWPRRS